MTGDAVAGASLREDDAQRFAGTGAGPALDRLAELARRILDVPAAQVSLLTDVQTVAGGAGVEVGGTGPLEESLCTVTARGGAPLVVTDAPADDRVCGLPPVTSGAVGSYLGVPLTTTRGDTVGALCVFSPVRRTWRPEDVDLLVQLSRSVLAELELDALTGEYASTLERWGLAIDAAGVGSFDWDLRSGELLWDDRLLALFGYERSEFGRSIEDFNARVHPEDLTRVTARLQEAIDACGTVDLEHRVVLPDGQTRWIAVRGRALRGEDGTADRLLGAAYDTTSTHEGRTRTERVLEAMSAAFYSLDTDWRFRYVNAEAERLLGRPRSTLLGRLVWELFPAAAGSEIEDNFRLARQTGQTVTFEAYYPAPLDGWYELRVWPSPDGLAVYFLDITERRAAQARLAAALRRAELVADVTAGLSDTLDAEEAVARLAELLVPEVADWCLVTLVDEDGSARDVGWAHVDPALGDVVERYAELRLPSLGESSYALRALRTGRPAVLLDRADEQITDHLVPGEAQELLRRLGPASATMVPMQARGRTVGLISVFNGPERGAYDDAEVATVRDVAARAALAIDNARLFRQQRMVAEELQRSLLTPPPEPDHMQVAVRYVAAAETAQVGGDWYDAFLQPDGGTVLVIGDVVGHDTASAAAMGQVRGLLRGIAFTTGEGPASVLTRLDAALEGLLVATTATAVVARLEQSAEERAQGVTQLRWSNAGHPPPMVVAPDGVVDVLGGTDADLLLGIDPSSPRAEACAVLRRGSTVLLYTDGLVERRGQSLDEGLERLSALLARLAHLPLDELCDELLRRLLPSRPDDDVALVAVRLHRQDRPRPAEAGPQVIPPEVPREP